MARVIWFIVIAAALGVGILILSARQDGNVIQAVQKAAPVLHW